MKIISDINEEFGMATAAALGYFDGLHLGHRAVIERALSYKNQGLKTAVFSFKPSQFPTQAGRAGAQIISFEEKYRLCREMGVDFILMPRFEDIQPLPPGEFIDKILISSMGARVALCGEDFRFGAKAKGNASFLSEYGGRHGLKTELVEAFTLDGQKVSSTIIRAALSAGDMDRVTAYLGRGYTYISTPHEIKTEGKEQKIYQKFFKGQALPRAGVYKSLAIFDGARTSALTEIHHRGEHCFSMTRIDGGEGRYLGGELRIMPCKYLGEAVLPLNADRLTEERWLSIAF